MKSIVTTPGAPTPCSAWLLARRQFLAGCTSNQRAQSGEPAASKSVLAASQVPDLVKQTLAAKFPAAKSPEWNCKTDGIHEAEFDAGRHFNGDQNRPRRPLAGNRIRRPRQLHPPGGSRHAEQAIPRLQNHRNANGGAGGQPPRIYELHLQGPQKIIKAQFSAEGAVLNQSEKPKPA